MAQFKVTGMSGQTEVIEAATAIEANGVYAAHHGEPARNTTEQAEAVIVERDTSDD